MKHDRSYSVAIIGSGFAGSLLAWILARQGLSVLLIDRVPHPRFAIGESSTPIADFLLRHLADRWSIPELRALSTWGSWKSTFPNLGCGKKRGFSYYQHIPNQDYADDQYQSRSYLVAASSDDASSDTHWLRSDVDQFFFDRALSSGATACVPGYVVSAERSKSDGRWQLKLKEHDVERQIECEWIVDASGNGRVIGQWGGVKDESSSMRTRTGALFAHFSNVAPFSRVYSSLHPELFDGDDAAQHHLMEDGWMWMLRFDHGVTSVGMVLPCELTSKIRSRDDAMGIWQSRLKLYPTLGCMLEKAEIVAPAEGLQWAERLSRRWNVGAGDGWACLPNAFGFVDPLHSTGIAHAISGVARIASAFQSECIQDELNRYGVALATEVDWIDRIVAGCYVGLPCFDRFIAMSAFYFIAAIGMEQQLKNHPNDWGRDS